MIKNIFANASKEKLSEQLILLLTWSEVTYLNQMGTFFKILSATLEEVLRHQLLGINFRAGGTRVYTVNKKRMIKGKHFVIFI